MLWKRADRGNDRALAMASQDFVWTLASLCQIHRIPFDAQILVGQFPGPHTALTLVDASSRLGLKCALRQEEATGVSGWAVPCVAFLKTANPETKKESLTPALVLRADSERVLMLRPGDKAPATITRDDFERLFSGSVLFAGAIAASVGDAESEPTARKFGFKWFVPELLKYRSIWRDVLLASLAIQLMALATPLFTQVVIDKVIVHHTMNTLIVIGIAMAVFMIFSAAMSWIRQYFILHTGNRIDAVLGSRVFEHLVKLPLRYYENRPTGRGGLAFSDTGISGFLPGLDRREVHAKAET